MNQKIRWFLFVAILVIMTTVACNITSFSSIPQTGQISSSPDAPPTETPSGCILVNNPDIEARLLELINQARVQHDLQPVEPQAQLAAAALEHTIDMGCNGYFDHTGMDGSTPFDRIAMQGYEYVVAGENLYVGSGEYNSPEHAVDSWLKSKSHREVLLYPDFSQVGISYRFKPNSEFGGFYTTEFGQPHADK